VTQLVAAVACGRCTRPAKARQLCGAHYTKLLRAGLLEPLMVDAIPTRRHIERLLATDWTRVSIARAAGVHVDTVSAIAAGHRRRILETVALAITSATIPRPRQETSR
jgi:hypothetical protein